MSAHDLHEPECSKGDQPSVGDPQQLSGALLLVGQQTGPVVVLAWQLGGQPLDLPVTRRERLLDLSLPIRQPRGQVRERRHRLEREPVLCRLDGGPQLGPPGVRIVHAGPQEGDLVDVARKAVVRELRRPPLLGQPP